MGKVNYFLDYCVKCTRRDRVVEIKWTHNKDKAVFYCFLSKPHTCPANNYIMGQFIDKSEVELYEKNALGVMNE